MSTADRMDPQVREGIDRYLSFFGPGGRNAITDLGQRRAKYAELLAVQKAATPPNDRVVTADLTAPGFEGDPDVPVRSYRPRAADEVLPAILFIHGGGMILGTVEGDDVRAAALAEAVGCAILSVEYRLAPEHPYPAALHDCYAALSWLVSNADALRIDASRIAVYGESAGGGLAAGLALMARDRGAPQISHQMLIYPMIDDRNISPSSREIVDLGIWDRAANLEGWNAYLAGKAGSSDVPAYAAPIRATDLSGLPPAYLDVGELDAFRDENLEYATRLMQAGVATELHVYPGAVHASQKFAPDAEVSVRTSAYRVEALRRAFKR